MSGAHGSSAPTRVFTLAICVSTPTTTQGESSGTIELLDWTPMRSIEAVNTFSQGLVEESARNQLALAIAPDDPKLQALDTEVSSGGSGGVHTS